MKTKSNIKNPANLERDLSTSILMLMANQFDRICPGCDSETSEQNMSAAQVTINAIVRKLTLALKAEGRDLNQRRWQAIVDDATRDATIDIGGVSVDIGTNASFRDAVATVTEVWAAIPGSNWAQAALERKDERHRRQLLAAGTPLHEVDRMVVMFRDNHGS